MAEKPFPTGCGRGGRGALLKAALEKSQRRPGIVPQTAESQTSHSQVVKIKAL